MGGKTGGAIWVCLEFLAPPFVSRQKVEKHKLRRMIKRRKFTTAILRQAQHDKAQETNGIAISIMMNAE